ncbi:MAG: hypothetical protein NXI10_00010 [bacterium]|nr:hypothetical protein [bacterium]
MKKQAELLFFPESDKIVPLERVNTEALIWWSSLNRKGKINALREILGIQLKKDDSIELKQVSAMYVIIHGKIKLG